jgi:hypothetical protein
MFDDPAKREDIGNDLVDICEDIIEREKGERDGLVTLNTVQKVNSMLAGIDLTRATPDSLPSIAKQLESIQAQVTRLQTAVTPMVSKAKKTG